MISIEDVLFGRRTQWKSNKKEASIVDDLDGRKPQWKAPYNELNEIIQWKKPPNEMYWDPNKC